MDVHDSASQLLKDLWSNKPLFFGVLAVVALVIYLLWKNSNGSAVVAPAASTNQANPNGVANIRNDYTSITYGGVPVPVPTANPGTPLPPVPTPQPPAKVQTIFPAPKGSLSGYQGGAANGDTEFRIYNISASVKTMSQLVAQMSDPNRRSLGGVAAFRNNAAILSQMGADVGNPNSPVIAGWVISLD